MSSARTFHLRFLSYAVCYDVAGNIMSSSVRRNPRYSIPEANIVVLPGWVLKPLSFMDLRTASSGAIIISSMPPKMRM